MKSKLVFEYFSKPRLETPFIETNGANLTWAKLNNTNWEKQIFTDARIQKDQEDRYPCQCTGS